MNESNNPVKRDLWVIDGVEYDGKTGHIMYLTDKSGRHKHFIDYTHYGLEEYWEGLYRHRIGGPAVIRPDVAFYDGSPKEEYWVKGVNLSPVKYWKRLYSDGLITEEEMFLHLL